MNIKLRIKKSLCYCFILVCGVFSMAVNAETKQLNKMLKINPSFGGFILKMPSKETKTYHVLTINSDGSMENNVFNGVINILDPAANGKRLFINGIGWNRNGSLLAKEASQSRSTDNGFLSHKGTKFSKYLRNRYGKNIGTVSLDNKKIIHMTADFNLDGQVDFLQSISLTNQRIMLVVLQTPENMRRLDEFLEGKLIFCSEGGTLPEGGLTPSLSQNPPVETIINACGSAREQESSERYVPTTPNPSLSIDSMCSGVLASSQGNNRVAQPPAVAPNAEPVETQGESVQDTVVDALDSAGQILMEAGGALGASGSPATAPAAAVIQLSGAALRLISKGVDWLDPIPGEENSSDEASLYDFCLSRARNKGSHNVDSINKAIATAQKNCGNPLESAGRGSSPMPSNGPVTPELNNPIKNRNCRESNDPISDLSQIHKMLAKSRCEEGRGCLSDFNAPNSKNNGPTVSSDTLLPENIRGVIIDGGFPEFVNPAPREDMLRRNK